MIRPSIFFTESVSLCGEPGVEFGREVEAWTRPALVLYPTIRRIDWRRMAEPWPGDAPELRSDASHDVVRYCSDTFDWARAVWRGFFAPQFQAIVPWRSTSFSGRECHPFALGYVRGALWELVDHATPGESWNLPAFIAISATADVFGIEWVDEIESAIDDLKGCGPPQMSTSAFREGARRGIEDMERYLDETDLEPWKLVEWFEACGSAEPASDASESRTRRAFDAARFRGAMTATTERNTIAGDAE